MLFFPRLKAWKKAIFLMLPTYIGCSIVFFFAFWTLIFAGIFSFFISVREGVLNLVISCGFLLFGMLLYLIAIGLYSLLLRLLWGNPPEWIKPSNSIRRHFQNIAVAITSTFPLALGYWLYVALNIDLEKILYVRQDLESVPNVLINFAWVWFICASCIYEFSLQRKKVIT